MNALQELGAHAITLNAYMGVDTVKPFLTNSGRGVFVLCKVKKAAGACNIVFSFFAFSLFRFSLFVFHGIILKGRGLNEKHGDSTTLCLSVMKPCRVSCVGMYGAAASRGGAACDNASCIHLIDDFDLAPEQCRHRA